MCTIVNVVARIHQSNAGNPVPGRLRVLSICIIVCISRKSGTEIEETAVRNGVLVIVTGKVGIDLPAKSTNSQQMDIYERLVCSPSIARAIWSDCLRVENCLCKSKPSRLIWSWILEVCFRRSHGSHAPKSLIVVTHRLRPIRGHHIIIRPSLPLYRSLRNIVVGRIASVVPVID